jgi:hypothetical protein
VVGLPASNDEVAIQKIAAIVPGKLATWTTSEGLFCDMTRLIGNYADKWIEGSSD